MIAGEARVRDAPRETGARVPAPRVDENFPAEKVRANVEVSWLLDAGMRFRCCSSAARCKSRTTSLREVHLGVSIDAGGEGLRALGGDGAKLIRGSFSSSSAGSR